MATYTSSVSCPDCCGDCGPDYGSFGEYHGGDECKTSAPPCSDGDPASCAGAQINDTIESTRSWFMSCIQSGGKQAYAYVSAYFDDLGSVSGETTASCDETGKGTCTSCGFTAIIKPIIVPIGNNRFKMRAYVQAQNAYWGGPYGYNLSVQWYIA